MALSDTAVKQAKPAEKEYTLGDGLGLSLLVRPNGKYWVFRYTLAGTRKKMFFGTYPEVPLKRARERRDEARRLIAEGTDPNDTGTTEEVPQVLLFRTVVQEWVEFREPRLTKGRRGSAALAKGYLDKDILPILGDLPLVEIKRADVLRVVRQVEARKAFNVAKKIRTWLHQIFRFAIVHGYTEINPATDLDIVAAQAPPVRHNPWLEAKDLGEFLRDLEGYQGALLVKLGIKLLMLTGVRTAEVRYATHDQFDLKKGIWAIPASSVKQLQKLVHEQGTSVPDYLVPLSRQAIAVVKEIQTYTSFYTLLLPGRSDPAKPFSENTLNFAIKRMGYEGRLTGHGLRGTLSTALYEWGYPGSWIEAQLSHADENKVRGAYNHAMYVEQRRGMMQAWADFLDQEVKRSGPYDPEATPRYRP
jgi:integrase